MSESQESSNDNSRTNFALLKQEVGYIRSDINEMKTDIKTALNGFASKEYVDEKVKSVDEKYKPIKTILFTALSAFGLAIVAAFAAFVISGGLK